METKVLVVGSCLFVPIFLTLLTKGHSLKAGPSKEVQFQWYYIFQVKSPPFLLWFSHTHYWKCVWTLEFVVFVCLFLRQCLGFCLSVRADDLNIELRIIGREEFTWH